MALYPCLSPLLQTPSETMKKVLITGATGLVGSHLTAELLNRIQQGETTYGTPVVVARTDASWGKLDWVLLHRGVAAQPQQRTTAQLEYLDDCRRLLHDERPQVVFHCAARVELGKTKNDEQLVMRNVEMVHNLITAALELPPDERPLFLHVSSIAALGNHPSANGCIDEQAVMENLSSASAYARGKFLSENEVWRGAAHGLSVAVVNPAVILGAMSPDSGFWFNGLLHAMRRGANRFWIEGEMAFVSADDVARALLALAETPSAWGKRYILSAENLTYRRFLTQVARTAGLPAPTIRIPRWMLRLTLPFSPSMAAVIDSYKRFDGSEIMRAVPFRYTDLTQTLGEMEHTVEKI